MGVGIHGFSLNVLKQDERLKMKDERLKMKEVILFCVCCWFWLK
jgi:hypothetical protein